MVTSKAPPGALRLTARLSITVSPILNLCEGIGHDTRAMAAKLTERLWEVGEIVEVMETRECGECVATRPKVV